MVEDTNLADPMIHYDFVYVDQEQFNLYHPEKFADLLNSFTEYKTDNE
jgi:hypothetical protein